MGFLMRGIVKNTSTVLRYGVESIKVQLFSSESAPRSHFDKYCLAKDPTGNCLTYALGLKRGYSSPWNMLPPPGASTSFNNIRYYSKILNHFYNIPGLCTPVEKAPIDSLPPSKEGYYLVAVYESSNTTDKETGLTLSVCDYHFVREARDTSSFTHRRGQCVPTDTDAKGEKITDPKKAHMRYMATKDDPPLDYRFVGYMYVKGKTLRPPAAFDVPGYISDEDAHRFEE
jgi:hypothetical protein